MSVKTVPRLRVEENKGTPVVQDLDYWKNLAVATGDRLAHAEMQARDLRQAADDAKARFGKYKERLDRANERVNELQVQVVKLSAQRDELMAQLAKQEVLARRVYDFRQSILNGPIWELFSELVVSPPSAGVEK